MLPLFTMLHVCSFLVSKTLTNNLLSLDHLFKNVCKMHSLRRYIISLQRKRQVCLFSSWWCWCPSLEKGINILVCVYVCVLVTLDSFQPHGHPSVLLSLHLQDMGRSWTHVSMLMLFSVPWIRKSLVSDQESYVFSQHPWKCCRQRQ